jgi:hypothetical protein
MILLIFEGGGAEGLNRIGLIELNTVQSRIATPPSY